MRTVIFALLAACLPADGMRLVDGRWIDADLSGIRGVAPDGQLVVLWCAVGRFDVTKSTGGTYDVVLRLNPDAQRVVGGSFADLRTGDDEVRLTVRSEPSLWQRRYANRVCRAAFKRIPPTSSSMPP